MVTLELIDTIRQCTPGHWYALPIGEHGSYLQNSKDLQEIAGVLDLTITVGKDYMYDDHGDKQYCTKFLIVGDDPDKGNEPQIGYLPIEGDDDEN